MSSDRVIAQSSFTAGSKLWFLYVSTDKELALSPGNKLVMKWCHFFTGPEREQWTSGSLTLGFYTELQDIFWLINTSLWHHMNPGSGRGSWPSTVVFLVTVASSVLMHGMCWAPLGSIWVVSSDKCLEITSLWAGTLNKAELDSIGLDVRKQTLGTREWTWVQRKVPVLTSYLTLCK